MIFRAYGAEFSAVVLHCRNRKAVLTQILKSSVKMTNSRVAKFQDEKFTTGLASEVYTERFEMGSAECKTFSISSAPPCESDCEDFAGAVVGRPML